MYLSDFVWIQTKMQIQPLETNKKMLTRFCLLPADEASTSTMKWMRGAVAFGAISFLLAGQISFATFFLKFVSVDLETALFAIWQLSGFSTLLYMILNMFLMRSKIKSTYEMLSNIYRTSKCRLVLKFDLFGEIIWEWCEFLKI